MFLSVWLVLLILQERMAKKNIWQNHMVRQDGKLCMMPETVQTGDKSNMMLYVFMIIVGVAGIAAVVIAAGRKKSEE